jgi:hypothetical protein
MDTPEAPQTKDASTRPPNIAVVQMTTGFFLSRSLIVAAEPAIADLVGHRPQTATKLATATVTHKKVL